MTINYIGAFLLIFIGLAIIVLKKNLIKIVIGMGIVDSGINLLKDQILTLLSIKDLIQPLLLLQNVDKTTPPDEANKLALNTENLINKYSDISSILGSNFSINDLIDSLLNNIRVLPDYSSTVSNMELTLISKKQWEHFTTDILPLTLV